MTDQSRTPMQDVKATPKEESKKETKGDDKKEVAALAEKHRMQQVGLEGLHSLGTGTRDHGGGTPDERGDHKPHTHVRAEPKGDEGRPTTIDSRARLKGWMKE